jgi:pimeloyl-ACP methyl ester carboxylesterase
MRLLIVTATLAIASSLAAQQVPRSIYTDPPRDSAHPARMEVLHIPSGGVKINGVAYLASGAGAHPTFVFFHGLPGNEKNLDIAQAVRRDGWNAITVNYRGSWGSPGEFRFANNLEDADAVLAFLRDSANARSLGIDTSSLVIAGHSMGGWVTALTAGHDRKIIGAILISMADMSNLASATREQVAHEMSEDMESLAGVTPESMADELIANAPKWRVADRVPGLARLPLLVITSNDGLALQSDALVKAVRALRNTRVTAIHYPTDHSYSDKRIALEASIVGWLDRLLPASPVPLPASRR